MGFVTRIPVIVAIGCLLASFAPSPGLSDAAFAALDPDRGAAALCGGPSAQAGLTAALTAAARIAEPPGDGGPIPLYPDLTGSTMTITTRSARARRYFSQGLMMAYGFNHAGAVRSFREAERLDPRCALCWWGEAVALGPNINAPMADRDGAAAFDAIDRAMALRAGASPVERGLIEATAPRYARDAPGDRAALDGAYADAMLAAAQRFPADDDVAVLAAEAAMDTTPWNYWEADRKTPVGRSGAAVRLVETVLRRNPGHPQAAHLYIHLLEASDPQRAEAAADRLLADKVSSAGHLVHMPSHIYYAVGRYGDSIRANIAAARSDEAFIRSAGDNGLVRYGYYPHNVHFIVTSAQMAGDMATAIREAQRLRTILDPATSASIGWVQAIDAAPFLAAAQFAAPRDILTMAAPDPRLPYAMAMRHYARAVAYAGLGDDRGFSGEISAMAALGASGAFADLIAQGVPAPDLLALASEVARGRQAAARGDLAEAEGHYRRAIAIEDRIPYQEPPYWYYPVRQSLGAVLFMAGRYDEASSAFRGALVRAPHNGWALYGLTRSESAAGHRLEAAAAERAFARAWQGDRAWLDMKRL